jgi:hypothetical protein
VLAHDAEHLDGAEDVVGDRRAIPLGRAGRVAGPLQQEGFAEIPLELQVLVQLPAIEGCTEEVPGARRVAPRQGFPAERLEPARIGDAGRRVRRFGGARARRQQESEPGEQGQSAMGLRAITQP